MSSPFLENATIVLVHGPWLGAGMWNSVILPLRQEGLQVIAAQLPLISFEEDLAAVKRSVERANGPLMLVGHSYSGALIAAAALHADLIRTLVFISGITPDVGETVADVLRPDTPLDPSLRLTTDRHGFIWMSEGDFETALAPHASAHQWTLMASSQKPISTKCLDGTIPSLDWHKIPASYLIAEEDHLFSASSQRLMAQRMNARTYIHPLDFACAATEPEVVLDVILEAAHTNLTS